MAVIRRSANKAKRGRPPKSDRPAQWTIRLPESVTGPWDIILYDARIGRSKIGLRQFIITELMRLLLEAWQAGKGEIQVGHILTRISNELTDLDGEL